MKLEIQICNGTGATSKKKLDDSLISEKKTFWNNEWVLDSGIRMVQNDQGWKVIQKSIKQK